MRRRGQKSIAVTRPVGRGQDTSELVRKLGWEPFIVHAVELNPFTHQRIRDQLQSCLKQGRVDWIVFMSSTGARLLFDSIASDAGLKESLYASRFLAVGPSTRKTVISHDVRDTSVPAKYSSSGVDEFFSELNPENLRILLVRSSAADDSLEKSLTSRGASVAKIDAYDSTQPRDTESVHNFLERLTAGGFSAVLFTSAITVSNLFKMAEGNLGESRMRQLLNRVRVGAIGPATAEELERHGIEPILPETYLIEDAVRVLISSCSLPT
jgi:uroporphyrinogen-III synthase